MGSHGAKYILFSLFTEWAFFFLIDSYLHEKNLLFYFISYLVNFLSIKYSI